MPRPTAQENVHRLPGDAGFRWWSQMVLVGGLGAAWLSFSEPVAAQWLGRPASIRNPAAQTAPSNGFVDSIRRLKREARQAAERGDLVAARSAAEQAHQFALNYQSCLTGFPDCAPEATAKLLRKYAHNSSVAPLEAVSMKENSENLARSLSELSDDMTDAPSALSELTATVDDPTRSPNPLTAPADQPPIRKLSSAGRKKKTRRPAPRLIQEDDEATAAVITERSPQNERREPEFTYFTAAIRWHTPGREPTAEEREHYLSMQSQSSLNETASQATEQPPSSTQPPTGSVESDQVAPKARSPAANESAPAAENPAVTTALGRTEDARMELDLDAAVENDSETQWPEWLEAEPNGKSTSREPSPTPENVNEPSGAPEFGLDDGQDSAPLADSGEASSSTMEMESIPEMLDADPDAGDTEFFAEPELQPSEPASMTHVTYSSPKAPLPAESPVPELLESDQHELDAPQSPPSAKPMVACRDLLAVEWSAADIASDDLIPAAAVPTPRLWNWESLTSEEKTALIGVAMLILGVFLFMASFRRDSRPA